MFKSLKYDARQAPKRATMRDPAVVLAFVLYLSEAIGDGGGSKKARVQASAVGVRADRDGRRQETRRAFASLPRHTDLAL
jgi:hypothetical protein